MSLKYGTYGKNFDGIRLSGDSSPKLKGFEILKGGKYERCKKV